MRRHLGPVAAAVVLILLVGACSGGSESDSPDPDSAAGSAGSNRSEKSGTSDSITIAMSGDVLLHNTTWASAERDAVSNGRDGLSFAPMFASLKPVISSADLAICHLETPLAGPDGPFRNYPVFSAPPQVLKGLKRTGYDACTTASNHSVDSGIAGVRRTIRAMRRNDLPYAGTARNAREARRVTMIDAAGAKVALLSYTFGTNGMPIEKPWSVNLIDPSQIKRDAERASERGADIVLVALHDGVEYVEQPTARQRRTARSITRSDHIDLVYGHHAHVPQPFEVVNGTWVAYGLGNFIAQQDLSKPETYRGTTARFTMERDDDGDWSVSGAEFIPTQITMPGEYADAMRVLDARAALRDPQTPESLVPTLEETVSAVRSVSFSRGARQEGLRMGGGR